MLKITRSKTKATGGITEVEAEALKRVSDKRIAIALRASPSNRVED